MTKPNLFVVGPQRCGTTALYYLLKQHPDIFMCEMKEPGYLAFNKRRYTLNEYLDLFEGAGNKRIIGEATAPSFICKKNPENIKEFNPKSKIIIMLRDPVDRLKSYYYWRNWVNPKKRRWSYKKFEKESIRKILEEELLYAPQIKKYYSIFGKNIRVIHYGNFREKNVAVAQKVYHFLGVDSKYRPKITVTNISGKPTGVWGRIYNSLFGLACSKTLKINILKRRGGVRDICLGLGRRIRNKAISKPSEEEINVDQKIKKRLYSDWDNALDFCKKKEILIA